MPYKFLDGTKVVELAELVTGPYCSKFLAGLGAKVTKVEKPRVGDVTRWRRPWPDDQPHPEKSGLFLWLNTNKMGVTLNLETATGKSLFRKLIAQADLLVHDKQPDDVARLGIQYDYLKEVNPRLVVLSITPFGQTGPYARYKAYPLNNAHGGGEGYITPTGSPYPDRPPLQKGNYVNEYEAGVSAAGAALLALYRQKASGTGQFIDFSKQHFLAELNNWELHKWVKAGVRVTRFTRLYMFAGMLTCKDGYVDYAPIRDEDWGNLVKVLGSPKWAQDETLNKSEVREQRGAELLRLVEEELKHYTREELYRKALDAHLPLAPCYSIDEVANSIQEKERGFFVKIAHKVAGEIAYPTLPYKFSDATASAEEAAPLLGEHNEEIYCNRLGLSRQDLLRLAEQGII